MDFRINCGTRIIYDTDNKPILNAVGILKRDIDKRCENDTAENKIILKEAPDMEAEDFLVDVSENIVVTASDELGFVYGLLYISSEFLDIEPFWFWMDQKIEKTDGISVAYGQYRPKKPIVKYRGWFVNDEVLIMKWAINGDSTEPWRMAFEALLRLGGNTVIPGTDKNSKKYRQTASDMGLWITHHHAEPLGAEMFIRAYPDLEPNYADRPELFVKLWEEGIKEQKDMKVIWCLGFRGQGDCPFWSSDTSGRFDTPEKRGALISEIIELQKKLVKKYVKNPVFCTNLYGEIMELYEEGHITLSDDIIKIGADNGYGKMVTRRRDNHTVRISSLPKTREEHGGIYYHVSFYDLQAANHITMLPNSVDFVNRELNEVIDKNAVDYWIINCSNVRPHTYFLDAVRKKWYGEDISDDTHSIEFAKTYFGGDLNIAKTYRDYHKAMLSYGSEEDEHAGEQFYTENIRLFVHSVFNGRTEGTPGMRWLLGMKPLGEQIDGFAKYCRNNLNNISSFYKKCLSVSEGLSGDKKLLFDSTLLLQVSIHYFCTMGVILFADSYKAFEQKDFKKAFMLFGDSSDLFYRTDALMRDCEYSVWDGFYFNDCFADIKHTAYTVEKLMGYARERGDNARHDRWYREAVYAPEDRQVMTLLVNDNHMTDRDLYDAFKMKEEQI